jgi:uncharacterized protein YndB with AHSA1/START domain
MTNPNELELSITKKIPGSRKTVFEAWLNPEALKEFIRPMKEMSVPRVDVDARVGGKFNIVMKVGGEEMPHHGEYKTIDRYNTLAFTWISKHSTVPGSLVTLTFKEISKNETELTLHHKGFENEKEKNGHFGGWSGIVESLQRFVS